MTQTTGQIASACRGMLAEWADARTGASGRSDKQIAARHIAVNLSDGCTLHMPAAVQLPLVQALWEVTRALHASREADHTSITSAAGLQLIHSSYDTALVHSAVLCLVGILGPSGGMRWSARSTAGRDACGQTVMAASCQTPPSLCRLGRCLCSALMLNRTDTLLLPQRPQGHLRSQCAKSQGCQTAWAHLCEAAALSHSGEHDDTAAALLHHLPKVSCGGLLRSLQANLEKLSKINFLAPSMSVKLSTNCYAGLAP